MEDEDEEEEEEEEEEEWKQEDDGVALSYFPCVFSLFSSLCGAVQRAALGAQHVNEV